MDGLEGLVMRACRSCGRKTWLDACAACGAGTAQQPFAGVGS